MSKKFQLVNFDGQGPSTSSIAKTDWKLCIICQEHTAEALRCPLKSMRTDKGSGYTTLAEHLIQFNELGQLPSTIPIGRLDEGHGIEAAMVANKAHHVIWSHLCKAPTQQTQYQMLMLHVPGHYLQDLPGVPLWHDYRDLVGIWYDTWLQWPPCPQH